MKPIKLGHLYQPQAPQRTNVNKPLHTPASQKPFAQHLQETLQQQELKFSQHAKNRLEERGIHLSAELMHRLENGLQKAQSKGANESLFITEGLAFVVSVKNHTVITAMDQEGMKENVITNIDSAVLL